jgi:diguanylate cyclase (GGDEF)-like protein
MVFVAVVALLTIWWFPTPSMDRAIWAVLALALACAIVGLLRRGTEKDALQLQLQRMQWEVNQLSRQVADLTVEARHDKLTGLGNRNMLEDRFDLAKERAIRNGTAFALLMIDLDEFKLINDQYGHAAGDEVLVAVAGRLLETVRGADTVIRLGGDEFVVLVEEADRLEGLCHLGQKLMQVFSADVELSSHQRVHVGASMGMAQFPMDGHEIVHLLDLADQGMYDCKASTRMPLVAEGLANGPNPNPNPNANANATARGP